LKEYAALRLRHWLACAAESWIEDNPLPVSVDASSSLKVSVSHTVPRAGGKAPGGASQRMDATQATARTMACSKPNLADILPSRLRRIMLLLSARHCSDLITIVDQ